MYATLSVPAFARLGLYLSRRKTRSQLGGFFKDLEGPQSDCLKAALHAASAQKSYTGAHYVSLFLFIFASLLPNNKCTTHMIGNNNSTLFQGGAHIYCIEIF